MTPSPVNTCASPLAIWKSFAAERRRARRPPRPTRAGRATAHHQDRGEQRQLRRDRRQAPPPRQAAQHQQRQQRQRVGRLLRQIRGERRAPPPASRPPAHDRDQRCRARTPSRADPCSPRTSTRRPGSGARATSGRAAPYATAAGRPSARSSSAVSAAAPACSPSASAANGALPSARPAQQPPDQHRQRAVVLAAVRVGHERDERVRRVARERQEQVIVAVKRRRREERCPDDQQQRDRDGDRPAARGHGPRPRDSAAIASARARSSGVFTLKKLRPSGSSAASSPSAIQSTAALLQQLVDRQLARAHARVDDRQQRPRVAGAQRLDPARRPRRHRVGPGRAVAQRREQAGATNGRSPATQTTASHRPPR